MFINTVVFPNFLEIGDIYKTEDKHEILSRFFLFDHLGGLTVNYMLVLYIFF
jgi:hypothetical protein